MGQDLMHNTEQIICAAYETSLGSVLVAETGHGLRAVLFGDDHAGLWNDLRQRFPRAALREDGAAATTAAKVVARIESPTMDFDVPLDLAGTAFQRAVWRALLQIPVGTTATYAEIATRLGRPRAARAVALACGANALAVVVPCHRVIRSDGSLADYRWGIERKRRLLKMESDLNGIVRFRD